MSGPVRREIAAIVRLASPVVATQLASMGMWVVDLLMVGDVGVHALDAVSLGRVWVMAFLIFAMGIVLGIDPILTQGHGAGDARLLGVTLQRGFVVSMISSVPVAVLWFFTEEGLVLLGQDAGLAADAERYVLVQLPLIPLFLVLTCLRQYLVGRGLVWTPLWVMILGNVVNYLANRAWIFGEWGFPELGIVGAGVATMVTHVFMVALLAVWIVAGELYRDAWTGWSFDAFRPRGILAVFRYGIPVGLHTSLEQWAFHAAGLFAGWIGIEALAAHVVVMNLASITFMVPMGISFAVVTRVGNLIGRGRPEAAQRAAWVAIGLSVATMIVSAACFLLGRTWLPSWYTDDPSVIATVAALLPIAAAFQIADGVQVVGMGVLRGMGRPRPATVFNLVGYYVVALPLAYFWTFRWGAGLAGIWWGLAVGLLTVAIPVFCWIAVRGPAKVDARIREIATH